MQVTFDGRDYLYTLDDYQELESLLDVKLEAPLEHPFGDLEKKATLEFAENDGHDGIDLTYVRETPSGWEGIKTVNVKLNSWAYNHVLKKGRFGTRYSSSGVVEIQVGIFHRG